MKKEEDLMNLIDLEKIKHKHLLLDTNIVIDSSKFEDEYEEFYRILQEKEVESILDNTVEFEFLRGANSQLEYKSYKKYLELLYGNEPLTLPFSPTQDIFDVARIIAQIAYKEDNKKLSLGDCLIAAQIQKYSTSDAGELYLATQNHKDFPVCLFNREAVHIITLANGNIKTIGMYTFNNKKYKDICKKLGLGT